MRSIPDPRLSVNPDLMTLKEASRATGVSVAGLMLLCRTGRLRYLRAGLAVWLRREDIVRMAPSKKGR